MILTSYKWRCNNYILPEIGDLLREYNRILITAPDGLKNIYKCLIEKYGGLISEKEVYFSAHGSYGACDLPVSEINSLKPDLIIHIGHNEYPFNSYLPGNVRIIYLPAKHVRKPSLQELELIYARLRDEGYRRVGIVATIQHTSITTIIRDFLEEKGINAFIGKSGIPVMEEGQILGCELSAIYSVKGKVDVFLVVAGGFFHALGVYLASQRPVMIYDPYTGVVRDYTRKAYSVLAKRYYLVEKVRNSPYHSLGLIIGSSPGQYRPKLLRLLYEKSISKGYKPYLVSSSILDMDRLIAIDNGLNLDFYVVTSCPRLPIDDLSDFYKPVLTPGEFRMVLEDLKEYVFPW